MIVMTIGIKEKVASDKDFAMRVHKSLNRFISSDWGDLDKEDWSKNSDSLQSLQKGEYGYILASYPDPKGGDKIWIIRDTEVTTVLFPNEH